MEMTSELQAAVGYLELGMPEDALSALQSLPPHQRMSRSVLEIKLEAEIEAERWNAGADTGRLLCLKDPEDPRFFIRAAHCLHETGDTAAARNWLLTGPTVLIDDPRFHYNIACYHAVLGEHGPAHSHLKRAVELDSHLKEAARDDESLASLTPAAQGEI